MTQTTAAISPTTLAVVHGLLADPESALDPLVTVEVAAAYETIPLQMLRDPWDRFIVATANVQSARLIMADRLEDHRLGALPRFCGRNRGRSGLRTVT